MNDYPQSLANAQKIEFDPEVVFPPDDKFTIPLFRLMLATDDARHLQKLILMSIENNENATADESSIINGELVHLFRMICSHLYEAGIAFRNLEEKNPGHLDKILKDNSEAIKILEYLRESFPSKPPVYDSNREKNDRSSIRYSFLNPIRQSIGSHYKQEKLEEAYKYFLGLGNSIGQITICEHHGLGRFHLTDHLIISLIIEHLGGTTEEAMAKFDEKVGEVISLAGKLAHFVDYLLIYQFKKLPGAIRTDRNLQIRVPESIHRGA